jgi:hypothetical protein
MAADPGAAAPDWARLAREIVTETNRLRRDPPGYSRHLDALLDRFDGPVLERPGRPFLRTEEGAAAVREAVAVLRAWPAPVRWSSVSPARRGRA